MSRFRHFFNSVLSGYGVLIATVVYSLCSIPLALYYLRQEEFGLWALTFQISGYVSLLDFGMSSSVARLLIDHKDRPGDKVYGSLIKTGTLVLLVQACIVACFGVVASPWLAGAMNLPIPLHQPFISILKWQCLFLAAGFLTRIFNQILTAHQRLDLANHAQTIALILGFIALWISLAAGAGVYSVVWGTGIGWITNSACSAAGCYYLKMFPPPGCWGKANLSLFKEIFIYGKSIFLVTLGAQLIISSQLIVITRTLGLEAAAMWSVCTKAFNLACQVIYRLFFSSTPALSEMIVREEKPLLRRRFQSLAIVTASSSGVVAVLFTICNGPFILLWTGREWSWPVWNDVLLGVWMVILSLVHVHNYLILLTKDIRALSLVYFLDGCLAFVAAHWAVLWGGIGGIIMVSILSNCCLAAAYGFVRSARYFGIPVRQVIFGWLEPMVKTLLCYLPLVLALWFAVQGLSPLLRFIIFLVVAVPLGFFILFRVGIEPALKSEILRRVPAGWTPYFKLLFSNRS